MTYTRGIGTVVNAEDDEAFNKGKGEVTVRRGGQTVRISPQRLTPRAILRVNIDAGRQVLKLLLTAPLRFTPIVDKRRRGYQFTDTIALDRILSAWWTCRQCVCGPRRRPMLLGKTLTGVASPVPASWNQVAAWLHQIDGLRRAA